MASQDQELKPQDEETIDLGAPQGEEDQVPLDDESDVADQDSFNKEGAEESATVDYAAELARLEEQTENYKRGMLNAKQKLKEAKDKSERQATAELDVDSLADRVFEKLRVQQEQMEAAREREVIDEELATASSSDDEQRLIKFIYENKIKHTGYSRKAIAEDMKLAKFIANRSKTASENEELRRAMLSKSTRSGRPSSSGTKRTVKREKQLKVTKAEKELLERYGAVDRYKSTNQ